MTDLSTSNQSHISTSLHALFARDISSYAGGIVCNVAGLQFSIGADIQQVVDNAMHYLFPSLATPSDDRWAVSFDEMAETDFDALQSGLNPGTAVAVKAGFAYSRSLVGEVSVFTSAEGFENDPHIIAVRGNRALIISPRATEVVSRLPIRLVREIGLRWRQNRGGCFVHAAAVSLDDVGLMIMGASGAGKTTTLAHLLRLPDARFVANDRGVLSTSFDTIIFDAWPLAVRVGLGTVNSFNELSKLDELRRAENRLAHDHIALESARSWGSRLKLEYTPLELCHRFGRHAAMSCRLRAVVLPHLNLSGSKMVLKRVCDPETITDILTEEITEPVDAEYGTGWLGLRTISHEEAIDCKTIMIDQLLKLPVFELVGDPRVPAEDVFLELTEMSTQLPSAKIE